MPFKPLLGFWINEKNGRKWMGTTVREELVIPEGSKLIISANAKKQGKQPDYHLMVAVDEEEGQTSQGGDGF